MKEVSDRLADFLEEFGSDSLEHYGVLGMKWGVRKDRRGWNKEDRKGFKKAAKKRKTEQKRYNQKLKKMFKGKTSDDLRKRQSEINKELSKIRATNKVAKDLADALHALENAYNRGYSKGQIKPLQSRYDKLSAENAKWFESHKEEISKLQAEAFSISGELRRRGANLSHQDVDNFETSFVDGAEYPSDSLEHFLADFLSEFGSSSLEHYGILGMKWGVRRYQNKDGTLTPAGRRRRAEGKTGESGEKKKTWKEKKAAREDAKRSKLAAKEKEEAEKRAKEAAALHDKILKDPKLLLKYKDNFSREEIAQAIKNFEQDKKLRELAEADINRGVAYINTFTKYSSATTAAYNSVAKWYNTFGAEFEEDMLPLIADKGKAKGKRSDKKKGDDQK